MAKKLHPFWVLVVYCLISSYQSWAQPKDPQYLSGFRIDLDSTKQKYIRIINWHQFWVRWAQNNPGSLLNGEGKDSQIDFAVRRSRILFLMQLSPRFLILTHMGINNQTVLAGGASGQGASGADAKKPQIFLHDIWAEYRLYKDNLSFGAGLHYWAGPTRMTNAATITFLTIDAPIHNWYNIEATDQFARYPGMYLKGKLLANKRVDYRVALNAPFALVRTNVLAALDTVQASGGVPSTAYRGFGSQKWMNTGYVQYQFWDIESNLLPFTQGTWLGNKKVLNVGAGWTHAPEMMWTATRNAATGRVDTARAAQTLWAVDAFLDMPLNKEKGTALTVYAAAQFYNMGKNYVRNIGISNPSNAVGIGRTWTGAGDATPTVGTGTILYSQAGYVLPQTPIGKFQPYAAASYAAYERLADPVLIPDLGFNYYLSGHNAKVTFNYRSRPYYDYATPGNRASNIVKKGNKPELTFQFQVAL